MTAALKGTKIEKIYCFSRCVQIFMASLIMTQSIIRMVLASNFHTFTGFMITFYLFVFSIAIFLIECNCIRARVWFYFMNYSLGKSIFYLFMTLLCFGSGATVSVFDIIVGAIFALMCMMFLTFHFIFKADEPAHV